MLKKYVNKYSASGIIAPLWGLLLLSALLFGLHPDFAAWLEAVNLSISPGSQAKYPASPIVFVDPSVFDYQDLIEAIDPGLEVIVLDSKRDGIEQITAVLAKRRQVPGLHIVSHGRQASLKLGNSSLSAAGLMDHAEALKLWAAALAEESDILLYGCSVAAGEKGSAFVRQLAGLTGANVSASVDRTGSAALGGDWQLEYATGEVGTGPAFSAEAMAAYRAILTEPVLDNFGSPSLPPIDEDASDANNRGILLADLIGSTITDSDSGAVEGIAVIGMSGDGTWQFSLDGTNWTSFGVVSNTNATVLSVLTPLYDGPAGGGPSDQGWLFGGFVATQTVGLEATTLDSRADFNTRDGYSSHAPDFIGGANSVNLSYPVLDPNAGYTVRIELQINSENHSSGTEQKNTGTDTIADRAGFNLISISNDTARGIELSFWENEIWAQEDGPEQPDSGNGFTGTLFTHAEGAAYTTTGSILYDLFIQGSNYNLSANGSSILTGALRDYRPWPNPFPSPPLFDVYETPNYLFLGDDTTSAMASFTVRRVELLEKSRIRFKPALNFHGPATITFRAWDRTDGSNNGDTGVDTATGGAFSAATETATITVNPVNDPPVVSDILDHATTINTPVGPIPFTIGDVDTPVENLTLTATSSNLSLVPNGNIALGGSGTNRTVTISPAASQTGVTTITISVDDGAESVSDTFEVSVGVAATSTSTPTATASPTPTRTPTPIAAPEEFPVYLPLILKGA